MLTYVPAKFFDDNRAVLGWTELRELGLDDWRRAGIDHDALSIVAEGDDRGPASVSDSLNSELSELISGQVYRASLTSLSRSNSSSAAFAV